MNIEGNAIILKCETCGKDHKIWYIAEDGNWSTTLSLNVDHDNHVYSKVCDCGATVDDPVELMDELQAECDYKNHQSKDLIIHLEDLFESGNEHELRRGMADAILRIERIENELKSEKRQNYNLRCKYEKNIKADILSTDS